MLRRQHVILFCSRQHQIHGLHILREGRCFPHPDDSSSEIQPFANWWKTMIDRIWLSLASMNTCHWVFVSLVHCWYSPKVFCRSAIKFSRYTSLNIQKYSQDDAKHSIIWCKMHHSGCISVFWQIYVFKTWLLTYLWHLACGVWQESLVLNLMDSSKQTWMSRLQTVWLSTLCSPTCSVFTTHSQ